MREIPKDIINEVNIITNELIIYKNENNMSWTSAYKDVLKKLNMQNKINDNKILKYTVYNLTNKGYDIEGIPFKLTKYK